MKRKAPPFERSLLAQLSSAHRLTLGEKDRLVVLSDLHMGNGGRQDDLVRNEDLLSDLLEKYYLRDGWILALNGDVEELQRFKLPAIQERWSALYSIFDRFNERGALYKILGNHDAELRDVSGYPYALWDSLRVETASVPLFVYHGHQVSQIFVKYNHFVRAFLRYVLNQIGVRNVSVSKDRRKRFFVERRIYEFSRRNAILSILGHTHRPLFESLAKYDLVKYEMEQLCRQFPMVEESEKKAISDRMLLLRQEMKKLKRKERRKSLMDSLYGDELLVPCMFNSGCAIGKKGVTVLEIDRHQISLVYWFTSGNEKKYVRRGGYQVQELPGTSRRRVVLNSDRLDYIRARIELLA